MGHGYKVKYTLSSFVLDSSMALREHVVIIVTTFTISPRTVISLATNRWTEMGAHSPGKRDLVTHITDQYMLSLIF